MSKLVMKPIRQFAANITDPSGGVETYDVDARNKTEARKKIGKLFRENTPPPSAGFYTFAQCRLTWIENGEDR